MDWCCERCGCTERVADGKRLKCRSCLKQKWKRHELSTGKARRARYRATHKAQYREYQRAYHFAYYRQNKEKLQEYQAAYRRKNKDALNEKKRLIDRQKQIQKANSLQLASMLIPIPLKIKKIRLRRGVNRELKLARQRRYVETHRAEIRAKKHAWRVANLEKIRAKRRAYRLLNKEKEAIRSKAYREANSDSIREKSLEYYPAHKEEKSVKQKAYYLAHSARMKAQSAAWRAAHTEEHREASRSYYHQKKRLAALKPILDLMVPLKGAPMSIPTLDELLGLPIEALRRGYVTGGTTITEGLHLRALYYTALIERGEPLDCHDPFKEYYAGIARGRINPKLIVTYAGLPFMREMTALVPEEQEKLLTENCKLAVKCPNEAGTDSVTKQKRVAALTLQEARRVFANGRINPPINQKLPKVESRTKPEFDPTECNVYLNLKPHQKRDLYALAEERGEYLHFMLIQLAIEAGWTTDEPPDGKQKSVTVRTHQRASRAA